MISFLRSIARIPSLATFVLNEIAPYKKDFEVPFPRLPQNIGLLGRWRIKLRASNSLFQIRLEAIADLTTRVRA